MASPELHTSLKTLLVELADGASPAGGFVLNAGDPGLLASLDRLSADDASRSAGGGATIAAHVAHVTYGISLMNRWAAGENPFESADWSAAWQTTTVDGERWAMLRADLRRELERWRSAVSEPRDLSDLERNGMIGSVVHLAYHLGAVRQLAPAARGPRDASS